MVYSEEEAWKLAEKWVYQGAYQPRNTLPSEIRSKVIILESGQQANTNTGQLQRWTAPASKDIQGFYYDEEGKVFTKPETADAPFVEYKGKIEVKPDPLIEDTSQYINPTFTQGKTNKRALTENYNPAMTTPIIVKNKEEREFFASKGIASVLPNEYLKLNVSTCYETRKLVDKFNK